jgi:hypothetical protein
LDKQKSRRDVAKVLYLACLVRADVLCATTLLTTGVHASRAEDIVKSSD